MSPEEVPASDLPDEVSSGTPVPQEDLPDTEVSGSEVPLHDLPDDQNKFAGQTGETGFEGAMRGATAGVSDALAKGMRSGASALGVPDEYLHYVAPDPRDMAARKETNPVTAEVSEYAGNALGLSKILPSVGSKALTGMIQMGAMGAGDELSKSMLGQGDPAIGVISHIATNGIMGLIGGKTLEAIENKGLRYIENSKLGTRINSFLSGLGHAASNPGTEVSSLEELNNAELDHLSDPLFKMGQRLYKNAGKLAASAIGGTLGAESSSKDASWKEKLLRGVSGAGSATFAEGQLENLASRVLGPYASALGKKYLAPTLMKLASSGPVADIASVIDHNIAQSKGYRAIENGVQGIFSAGAHKALDYSTDAAKREKLKKYVEDGGAMKDVQDNPQGFAEGGQVSDNQSSVAEIYPEQNMLLHASKMRVSNYLNSKRPMGNSKLPYDNYHQDKTKERDYDKSLDLAIKPLSVLKHIKEGSLVPRHVKDLNSMYPELHDELSKKITEEMTKQELKGEKKPPRKVRQSLSLFLGAPLSTSLTPQSIMAAQATFIVQKAQNAGDSKANALKEVGSNSQTPEQSREQRLNKK